ncbi:hypothetical protein MJO29_016106 [Puccinia striiformis f. sp. tritici]|nr:hypothetical protein MJO29_016106 [Puccinia striiformis f. sp. tritici]
MVSLSNDSLCDSFGFKSESLEVVSHENDRLKANFFHKVGSRLANVLFDTGAGSSYVSEKFVALESLSTFSSPVPFAVTGAFGDVISNSKLSSIDLFFSEAFTPIDCRVAPLANYDIILGRDWISLYVESTNWARNEWRINAPNGKTISFFPGSGTFAPSSHNLAMISDDLDIIPMSRQAFRKEMKKKDVEIFVCTSIDDALNVLGPREKIIASLPETFSSSEPFGSKLRSLVSGFADLFSTIDSVSQKERTVEHLINTGNAKPVFQQVRQLSPALLQELKERLKKLQSTGFIRPSTSPWSSPILFAKNANGSLRFCVDYRALNSVTKRDRHPLPLIQECFDSLKNAKYFTKIDLQQGFHQMKISPEDVPKTAFGTKYGHFEWSVMPFGLVNAPSTFQRMMTHVLREYIDDFVQVYLDDILIYSASEEEHLQHVKLVLEVLRKEELRCSGHKCSFGLEEIQYVGHLVSHNSIRPMPEKLDAIKDWPRPSNVHDVRLFLGLCGYYRRYVRNFAKIASPLHDLTAGNVTKRQVIPWLPVHELAFTTLKEALMSAPVLLVPDLSKPFVIETDASDFAVGAVLLQKGTDEKLHPVAFESSKLNSSQRNYPAQERELLSIINAWRKWQVYLDGAVSSTEVFTDHASLQFLSTQKLPSKRISRWIEEFAEMDIVVKYKRGEDNIVPDALSRRADLFLIDLVTPSFKESDWPLLIPYLRQKRPIPSFVSNILKMRAEMFDKRFEFDSSAETLVYLGTAASPERSPFIPSSGRYTLLTKLHDDAGHRGRDATLGLLRTRGWWPHRYNDVKNYVRTCAQCQIHERPHPNQETAVQRPLPLVGPFERWAADFISMPESRLNKYKWILTIIDHCTSWPIAIPMKDASSANIARVILDEVITPFGLPLEFLTDRGSNFLSGGLTKFLAAANISKLNTSGYHPRTNGKCERYNGILEAAIFCLNKTGDVSRWEDFLPAALYSTRIHSSDSSKFSPFELTYGIKPRLPSDPPRFNAVDLTLPGEDELRARIKDINDKRLLSARNVSARADDNKRSFDEKLVIEHDTFAVGDSVKLRNESHTKGNPRWFGPFEIKKILDKNVYILIDQDGEDYSRPVNGNDLRPVSLRSLISSDMWATPPAITLKAKQKEARLAKELMKNAKDISKITPEAPLRKLRLRLSENTSPSAST